MSGLQRLTTIMRLQSVLFALYGVAWFLIPAAIMDSLFSMSDAPVGWIRVLGGAFLGIAWLEWMIVQRLEERIDLVWPFAFIPGLFLVANLWDKAAGTFDGTDSFFWMAVVVTGVFAAVVAWARMGVKS